MRASIRIARDAFLAGAVGWAAAHLITGKTMGGSALRPWIEGGAGLLIAALTVFWRIERDVVRTLDGMTRALMQPGSELRSSPPGDLDEMHDLQLALDRLLSGLQVRIARDTGERDRLIKILNALPVGIFELDGRGRIVFQNRALMDLLDTSVRAVGRTPVEVIRSGELQE